MKILLGIDGSSYSDAAVLEISRRDLPPHSEIRLITVYTAMLANALAGRSIAVLDELNNVQHEEAVRHLEAAAAVLKQNSPEIAVTSVVREGSPDSEILDEARSWQADLIVVGSHGKGALLSLLLGSVSSAITTHAPCSVEIVRSSPAT